jgi:hypothetical protein
MADNTTSSGAEKPKGGKRKGWIKSAIKHPGAFKAKAEAAGESTRAFAAAHAGDKGKTGAQARLAQTLMGMHHKKLYDHPSSNKK